MVNEKATAIMTEKMGKKGFKEDFPWNAEINISFSKNKDVSTVG